VSSPRPAEILERIIARNGQQPRDWSPAARDDNLAAPLHPLEILAQPIVQLAHPYFVLLSM